MDLVELTEFIIKSIVNDEEAVSVKEFDSEDENTMVIQVVVAEEDIKELYDMFERLELTDKKVEETTGADVTSFRFNLSDGTNYDLIYGGYGVKNGSLKSATGGFEYFTSADIAEVAERLNFSGIGLIDAISCHVDKRTKLIYVNDHWFGDERTGNDNIKTFQRGTKFPGDNISKSTANNLKVILNGVTIIDKNF